MIAALALSLALSQLGPIPKDKLEHFAGGAVLFWGMYFVQREMFGVSKGPAVWTSTIFTASLMAAREAWGNRDGGDFFAGMAPIIISIPILALIEEKPKRPEEAPPEVGCIWVRDAIVCPEAP